MTMPFTVEQIVVRTNKILREQNFISDDDGNVVLVSVSDVKQEGLILKQGVHVRFKLYATPRDRIGGCKVESARRQGGQFRVGQCVKQNRECSLAMASSNF